MPYSSHPQFPDIQDAVRRISPHIKKTPVLTSQYFNDLTGSDIYFKCENFQKIGAFKFRGACNSILSKTDDQLRHGVITHSSGNHAQAVALAARMKGVKATIVMPENAPDIKIKAVRGYGADLIFCEPTIKARIETAKKVVEETGAYFVHPYNDPAVIAGQGTCAKELLEEIPDLDIIIAPVGGGGLLSGTSIAARHINPNIQIVGVEPEIADDAYRSFQTGTLQPVERTDTIADGLRTSLGELPFSIIRQNVDEMVTVSEESIIRNMRQIWERMKIIVEASGSVTLAAVTDQKINCEGKKTGVLLTGGNADLDHLPWMIKEPFSNQSSST
ncbi:MAG: pyridoxal-phosphate dependent enzyme [Balneolaceae bacterium]